jgi:hypothetical protein
MRVIGLLLVLVIFAGEGFINQANQDPAVAKAKPCTGQWQGTITYRITTKKQGTAESKVTFSHWNEEAFYETKTELDGSLNAEGAPIAKVRAVANESKEWGSRGKGICYRETDNSQAVSGTAHENTTAFSVILNPRTREYSILAPVLMVYASGQHVVSSRVKGTCNNPYNKDFNQVDKIERYQLSDDAPTLMGKGTIDPAKPNELAGSETAEHDTKRGKKTVTIKWDLRRCSGSS